MNIAVSYLRIQFPDVNVIDTDKAKEEFDDERKKVWLIDCRRPDEYQVSKIPGIVDKITK